MKVWGDVPEELTEANCCQLQLRLGKIVSFRCIYNSKCFMKIQYIASLSLPGLSSQISLSRPLNSNR